MPRPRSRHPTELELSILKVFWSLDRSATVRDVQQGLAEAGKSLAYTSVITVMNIMTRKGYLACRRVEGGASLYTAKITSESTASGMLRDLIDRVFEGSALELVVQLFDDRQLDKKDLDELRAMVDRAAKKSGKKENRP
jgi:predicted transcriptional regulator